MEAEKSWKEKRQNRLHGVLHIRVQDEYRKAMEMLDTNLLAPQNFPVEPDYNDPGLSKRAWEKSMQRWREQLRRICKRQ